MDTKQNKNNKTGLFLFFSFFFKILLLGILVGFYFFILLTPLAVVWKRVAVKGLSAADGQGNNKKKKEN